MKELCCKRVTVILLLLVIIIALVSYNSYKLRKLTKFVLQSKSQISEISDTKYSSAKYSSAIEKYLFADLLKQYVQLITPYTAYDENGEIALKRLGRDGDGGYAVAVKSLEQSDVLLGYGVAGDISFEEQYSLLYHNPSYGFDCTIDGIDSTNKAFTFIPECIVRDIKVNHFGDKKISTFSSQLQKLKLQNKKLFVKMDIEGGEYDVIEDILRDSSNITGLVFELHIQNKEGIIDAINLLSQINKDFVLLHIHASNNASHNLFFKTANVKGDISLGLMELSYINKNLVSDYHISKDLKFPKEFDFPNVDLEDIKFEIINPYKS